MQNITQPLGPFPADIVPNIAQQDPRVYSRLSQASSRLRQIVKPVLPQVCQAPFTGREIINNLPRARQLPVHLRKRSYLSYPDRPLNRRAIYNITPVRDGGVILGPINSYGDSQYIPSQEAGPYIEQLIREGYALDFDFVVQVYKNRASCYNLDPGYARKFLARAFRQFWTNNLGYRTRLVALYKFGSTLNPNYRLPEELTVPISEKLSAFRLRKSGIDFRYRIPDAQDPVEVAELNQILNDETQRVLSIAEA